MNDFFFINANVFLFPSKMGGKSWNIADSYYPNLVWGLNKPLQLEDKCFKFESLPDLKVKCIDGLFFLGKEEEELGKFFQCKIRINKVSWIESYIYLGKHFYIREGLKIVGLGVTTSDRYPFSMDKARKSQ